MTLRQTAWTFIRSGRIDRMFLFFFPIHRCRGQWFFMVPKWYNGHFHMTSLNKARF